MPGTTASLRDRGNTQQCKETFLTITSISPAFSYVTPQPVLLLKTFYVTSKGHNFEVYTIYKCYVM